MMTVGHGAWVEPSRRAVEPTHAFAVPYGSARPNMGAYRADNPRLAGLGCEGDRTCAKCASAQLNESRYGPRSLYGMGAGATFGGALTTEDALNWANTVIGRCLVIAQTAKGMGGPGLVPSDQYYASFAPMQGEVGGYIDEYANFQPLLPYDVNAQLHDALVRTNALIQGVFNGNYDTNAWDVLISTLRQTPTFVAEVASGTAHDLEALPGQAAGAVRDAAEGALSFGKYTVVALVALAAILLGRKL